MILTTQRLMLREIEEEDWRTIYAYQSKPLFLRFTPWTHRTQEDARKFVHLFLNWRNELPRQGSVDVHCSNSRKMNTPQPRYRRSYSK